MAYVFWHSFRHILGHSSWHFFWHLLWHCIWHPIWHSFWHLIWQFGIYSDILSGILSSIHSGILELAIRCWGPGVTHCIRSWQKQETLTWQVGKMVADQPDLADQITQRCPKVGRPELAKVWLSHKFRNLWTPQHLDGVLGFHRVSHPLISPGALENHG